MGVSRRSAASGPDPDVDDIAAWLDGLGLGKYAAVFAEHEISLDLLPDLTTADTDQLGLPLGPRRRLIVPISALEEAGRSVARRWGDGVLRLADRTRR